MIYVNLIQPITDFADKNILYMQNDYPEGAYEALKNSRKYNYDGYAFISNKLLEMQKKDGFDGIFLPFGVDISIFHPKETKKELAFDVAYIGNDIKLDRTDKYLLPGAKFNFGLFGNWPEKIKERGVIRNLIFFLKSL